MLNVVTKTWGGENGGGGGSRVMKNCLKTAETAVLSMMAKHPERPQEYCTTTNPISPSGEPCKKWTGSRCMHLGCKHSHVCSCCKGSHPANRCSTNLDNSHTESSINGYHKLPYSARPPTSTFCGNMNTKQNYYCEVARKYDAMRWG